VTAHTAMLQIFKKEHLFFNVPIACGFLCETIKSTGECTTFCSPLSCLQAVSALLGGLEFDPRESPMPRCRELGNLEAARSEPHERLNSKSPRDWFQRVYVHRCLNNPTDIKQRKLLQIFASLNSNDCKTVIFKKRVILSSHQVQSFVP